MILDVLSVVLQVGFLVVVLCFAAYVLLEMRVLLISSKSEKCSLLTEVSCPVAAADQAASVGPTIDPLLGQEHWPTVSVLLPVRNESAMIQRLIDAVCAMQYPASALEILVLDDSTDHTSDLAQRCVAVYAEQGVNIRYVQREKNNGYKAGNLANGMRHASGDFFAIFDADFAPSPDFLQKTLPFFSDPGLGFLQTGIGYQNRDTSFLTRFQAMEMGHQQVVTVGLSADGDMASLSGSSCVWRKTCVDELGGWNDSTVTEDVDLGYRAQISNWKYVYLRDVVSMSVLPESVSAFRIQRERWGRGLIHSGFKHVGQMLRQPMPIIKRLHALAMMFSALLLAAIYGVLLLCLPLNYLVSFDGSGIHWVAMTFFAFVALWAINNVVAARKGAHIQGRSGVLYTMWDAYVYVALFLPMAWYYFAGGIRALFGVYGDFYRTPKGKNETHWPLPPFHRMLWTGDIFNLVYSAASIWVAFGEQNYFLIPINVTACVGFSMMLIGSLRQKLARVPAKDGVNA